MYIVSVLIQMCSLNLIDIWDYINSVVFHSECTVQAWMSILNMIHSCCICVYIHVYTCLYWINDSYCIQGWHNYDGSMEK